MKHKALYIPLSIKRGKMQYYSMLHYSLTTLHKFYNKEFDIFISVSSPDFDIWAEDYLRFNLVRDFPKVNFFKSDYFSYSENPLMHKWYDIDKVFAAGYDLVFCFDCDTVFYKNIDYFFTKYDDGNLWSLYEGPNEEFFKVLDRHGMCGGQIMFPRNIFYSMPDFNQQVVAKQKELVKSAYEKMDEHHAKWFDLLSEQYAVQMVFLDNGYTPSSLDCNDVCFGRDKFDVQYINNDISITSNLSAINYLGSNYWMFLPNEYLTEQDLAIKQARIKQRDI